MIGAFRGEVGKLVTLPALAVTVALTWAATVLLGLADPPGGVLAFSGVGFLVLGVLATGQEFQGGGQIRASLLAVPRRTVLMVAKLAAVAGLAAPVVLVAAGLAGEPAATGRLLLDVVLGAAVGMIVRHPVAAAGVLLVAYRIGLPLARPHLPEIVVDVPSWAWTAMIVLVAGLLFRHRGAG